MRALLVKALLLVCTVAWCVAGIAHAARATEIERFSPFYYSPDFPKLLFLEGEIDLDSPLAFRRALLKYPQISVVSLNSPGGVVVSALIIADEINRSGLASVVAEPAQCLSACAFLFFAGKARVALGKLGVHQMFGGGESSAQANVADLLEAFARYGVDGRVATIMLRTPPNDMHIFTENEITELGLNRDIPPAEPASELSGAQQIPVPAPIAKPAPNARKAGDPSAAASFILKTIEMGELPAENVIASVRNLYAESVKFFGRDISRDQLFAEKRTYLDRWPIRSYQVDPTTVASYCNDDLCAVSGSYRWSVAGGKGNRRTMSGLASFEYVVRAGDEMKIISEGGAVLAREQPKE